MTEQHECEHKYNGALCPIPDGGFAYYIFCIKCEYKPPLIDAIKSLNEYETPKNELAVLKGEDDGTEICLSCGSMVEQVWHTEDDTWNKLSGYPDGNGILCTRCFDRMAQSQGVHLYWSCQPNSYPIYADILEGKDD